MKNNAIPGHVQQELSQMTTEQVMKFHELVAWSSKSGLAGIALDGASYDNIMDMVRRMGSKPVVPIEPDRTVNHDWEMIKPQIIKG